MTLMQRMEARPVVEKIMKELSADVAAFKLQKGRAPSLAVVLVGNDPASVIYTTQKEKKSAELGITHQTIRFAAGVPMREVRNKIDELNSSGEIDGILIQRPVLMQVKEDDLVYWVSREKDVDGFHPENVGRLSLGFSALIPCTPMGILALLEHYNITIQGKIACVIGRSTIVGKPIASLLLSRNATVLHCHSKTQNLEDIASQADILIAAVGKRHLITENFVKPGAAIIDVGIHRDETGAITGDTEPYSVSRKASAWTPVPGGVGPMTIAMLMKNTVKAAQLRNQAVA